MSRSLIQQKFASASHAATATFTSAPTAGNMLGAVVETLDGAKPTVVSTGDTWVEKSFKLDSTGTGARVGIWYALNGSAASTAVVATEAGATFAGIKIAVFEVDITTTSGDPTDGTNTANGTGVTADPGSVTPTAGRDAIIIMGQMTGSGINTNSGPTNSFTSFTSAASGQPFTAAYLLVPSTSGSYSASYGTSNNYNKWCAAIVVFYQAGASGAIAASLTGAATLDTASLKGAGALADSMLGVASISAALVGAGALASSMTGSAALSATLAGSGSLVVTMTGAAALSATLTASGALADAMLGAASISALLNGAGALASSMTGVASLSATPRGAGALASAMLGAATLTGSLATPGAIFVSMLGAASLTATLRGAGAMSSGMLGVASITALLGRTALMATSMLGVASISATIRGSDWVPIALDNGPWTTITQDTAGWTRIT